LEKKTTDSKGAFSEGWVKGGKDRRFGHASYLLEKRAREKQGEPGL